MAFVASPLTGARQPTTPTPHAHRPHGAHPLSTERIGVPLAMAVTLLGGAAVYFNHAPHLGLVPDKVAQAADVYCRQSSGCRSVTVTQHPAPDRLGVARRVVVDFEAPFRPAMVEALRARLRQVTPLESRHWLTLEVLVDGASAPQSPPPRPAKAARQGGQR